MNTLLTIFSPLILASVLFLNTAGFIFAQSNNAITYKQEKLMLRDEKGDEVLLKLFSDTCTTGVKKVITQTNVPPQESQLRTPRFAKENPIIKTNVKPVVDNTQAKPLFNQEKTLEAIKKIIEEEEKKGIKFSGGRVHAWNNYYHKHLFSKIIMALATASSSRFLYVGQEIPLINWLRTQPDNSVNIEALFHKSYILNKGNLYLTILTIENVLSDATFEKDREDTMVNHKLVNLYEESPNKFGDWYHFFGTMLAGYVGEPSRVIAQMYSVYRRISRGDTAEKSTIEADKAGANMGVKLRRYIYMESLIRALHFD